MRCPHYDAGECRSCTLMGTPYEQQLANLDAHVREVLAEIVPHLSLIHISEPTRRLRGSRMPSSA